MRKREAIESEGMNVAQDGAEHWRRAVLETLLDIRELQMPYHAMKYAPRFETYKNQKPPKSK